MKVFKQLQCIVLNIINKRKKKKQQQKFTVIIT